MSRRSVAVAMLALALLAMSCGQPQPPPQAALGAPPPASVATPSAVAAPSPTFAEPAPPTRPATRAPEAATPFLPPPTPTPLPAGVYLEDGFERGDLDGWHVVGTGAAVVQRQVVRGGQGAAALTTRDKQYVAVVHALQGDAQALAYTRFCFLAAGLAGATVLAQGRDASGNYMWEIDYEPGVGRLDVYFWNGKRTRFDVYTPENSLAADAWNCIEIQSSGTSEGTGAVWINGKPSGAVAADFSVTRPYSQLYLWNSAPTGTVYFDDVKVANTDSGLAAPEQGASPARASVAPAGPIPAGWAIYNSAALPFALAYPPTWVVDESHLGDGVVYFRSASQPTTWVMIATRVKVEGRTADELRDEYYREQFADCQRRGIEVTRDTLRSGIIFKELGTTCDLADGLYYSYIGLGLREGVPWRYRLNALYAQYKDNDPTFAAILATLNIYANPQP